MLNAQLHRQGQHALHHHIDKGGHRRRDMAATGVDHVQVAHAARNARHHLYSGAIDDTQDGKDGNVTITLTAKTDTVLVFGTGEPRPTLCT